MPLRNFFTRPSPPPTPAWVPRARPLIDVVRLAPPSVSPGTLASEAWCVAVRAGVHHLPVANGHGTLLGVVCRCDLHAAQPDDAVASCLHAPPVSVEGSVPAEVAAQTLVRRGVGCLIVTHAGAVVGMVTRSELLRAGALTAELAPACRQCGSRDHVMAPVSHGEPICRRCIDDELPILSDEERELGGGD